MWTRKLTLALAPAVVAMGLVACDVDVDKTESGNLPDVDVKGDAGKLPNYDVDVRKTEEGRAPDLDVDAKGETKLPSYDVDVKTPEIDVDAGDLPKYDVDVKKTEEGRAPDIDVTPPADHDDSTDMTAPPTTQPANP